MRKIDLHTHTTASDGIRAPEDLIDFAMEHGVEILAITDHDTVLGLNSAMEYARKKDFTLIPGIEFSVDYTQGSFHLVGLYIDYNNPELLETTKKLNQLRESRTVRIIEDLKKHDIHITLEEVNKECGGGTVGRPHVARVLINNGYAAAMNEVFDNFLVKGKPGHVKKDRISLDEAIALIQSAGGIPVIAHPASLRYKSFELFEKDLPGLIEKGIEGIEVFASMHSPEEVEGFRQIAEKYKLLMSGGSDYHGDKDETIGNYAKDTVIPFEIYEALAKRGQKE
ncbi:MAG: PHP domain-containing protein [bacterium]|nr:PHP domain-containing protein [bacterium]